ncbi:phosphotransferase system, HPr-related protein [Aquipseudomonas alcaligenes]|uniref:phosphotransferase system, HPr-related protein n=1 Tax=Aquipseudomonas alcaligenes TaxID=43263 RepID=UPI003749AEDE
MNKPSSKVHDIDDTEDRMGSIHELDFDEKNDERQGRVGDERPAVEVSREFPRERESQAGMSGGETLAESTHEDGVNLDDLSPDTLIDESGARSPDEPGEDHAADQELQVVEQAKIGGGIGLDEAELARSAPLDGKPWTDQVSDEAVAKKPKP